VSSFVPPDWSRTPSLCGYRPLNMLARLGQHDGIAARKFEYVTPDDSQAFVFGMLCHMSNRASSRLTNRMFGLSAAAAGATRSPGMPATINSAVAAKTAVDRPGVVIRMTSA